MNLTQINILSYQNRSQYHIDSTISFTGKERDEETGYGYFGSRYYNADLLTGWLSVDPMADKYPLLSPFSYCGWNPMILKDPNGMIIDSSSVSQDIKNMINPDHECYNADFATIYKYLDKDNSTTYRFEKWESFHINHKKQTISGSVYLSDDNTLVIGYTWGLETANNSEIAPERALCEELRHAQQFCNGEFGFFRTSPNAQWFVCGYVDEVDAYDWAARTSGSTPIFDLSFYSLCNTVKTAEDAWVKDNLERRSGTTPQYDVNGLYSSDYWYFKKPKQ